MKQLIRVLLISCLIQTAYSQSKPSRNHILSINVGEVFFMPPQFNDVLSYGLKYSHQFSNKFSVASSLFLLGGYRGIKSKSIFKFSERRISQLEGWRGYNYSRKYAGINIEMSYKLCEIKKNRMNINLGTSIRKGEEREIVYIGTVCCLSNGQTWTEAEVKRTEATQLGIGIGIEHSWSFLNNNRLFMLNEISVQKYLNSDVNILVQTGLGINLKK